MALLSVSGPRTSVGFAAGGLGLGLGLGAGYCSSNRFIASKMSSSDGPVSKLSTTTPPAS